MMTTAKNGDDGNLDRGDPAHRENDDWTLDDLRAEHTGGESCRLAVLGDPVAHSLSPGMHNAALAACDLPVRYTRLRVHPDELAEALRLLPTRGFLGANLTIPHKTAALPLMGALDENARRLGAVNTVRVEPGGVLRGFNTDGPGFVRAVREEFGGAELPDLRVLILGAGGGAGRALAAQCAWSGCAGLVLANRTEAKAEALAAELRREFDLPPERCAVAPWAALAMGSFPLGKVDLVVHATSLGLRPGDPLALDAVMLRHRLKEPGRPELRVFDTVYRRDGRPTPLVEAARAAGARAVDGLSLLLHQGALAFEIWFDRPAPLGTMRAALRRSINPTADGEP